jgi:PAS domain S-box-containing protein
MPFLADQREPEALLRALVHSSPLPIIVYGTDYNITLWNAAAERVFGWTAAEVLGKPIPFIPEDKREEHYAMRARDLKGEGFTERELRRRRKDGSTIYVRVSTEALRDATGAINGVMCIFVDITDSKRREQRLLAQYNVARILAESVSIAAAAPRLVQKLCEDLGWQAGCLATAQGDLECEAHWPSREKAQHDFGLPERISQPGSHSTPPKPVTAPPSASQS